MECMVYCTNYKHASVMLHVGILVDTFYIGCATNKTQC